MENNIFVQNLNEVFNDDIKRSLLFIAITNLTEKANTENWAESEKLYDAAVKLVEIHKDLSEGLEDLQL